MTKEEILAEAKKTFETFTSVCAAIDEPLFFQQPAAKWSVAQNVKHLVVSASVSNLAFTLPQWMVLLVSGSANRPSKSYEALVEKYRQKLAEGGRASGRFVPKPANSKETKILLLQKFQKVTYAFLTAVEKNRTEAALDKYLAPHPLLGKITLRELCYFTIYHTQHHQQIIEQRTLLTSA